MLKSIVGLGLIAGATIIHAQDQSRSLSLKYSHPRAGSAELLHSTDPGADRFLPVGKLKAAASCTASLISGLSKPPATSPALVLTAGHCVGSFGSNDVVIDQPPGNDSWQFTPRYFINTQPQPSYPVNRVVYATMKQGDWAILQLDASYGLLSIHGIQPIPLRELGGVPDNDIELTHIPVDGVPPEEQYLRLSTCRTGTTQAIFEGGGTWYWPEAMPNDCAGVAGGSSGSPLFLAGTQTLVGVLNTTVDKRLIGCGLNRPCELKDGSATTPPTAWAREGASYANPIDRIARALRPDGSLDVAALDGGDGVVLKRQPGTQWTTQSWVRDENGVLRAAEWSVLVDETTPLVRFKHGPATAVHCELPGGDGQPVSSASQPLLHLPVQAPPAQEGIYKVCVIATDPVTGKAQDPRHASVLLREIDNTSPTVKPTLVIRAEDENFWWISAAGRPYEIATIDVKYGPSAQTHCDDPDGYIDNAGFIKLSKSQAPWRVCAKGYDSAHNPSPIEVQDYQ